MSRDAGHDAASIVAGPVPITRVQMLHGAGFLLLCLANTLGVVIAKQTSVAGAAPWWPPAAFTFAYLVIVGHRGFVPAFVARYVALWIGFDWDGFFLPAETAVRSAVIVATYTLAAIVYRRFAPRHNERGRLLLFLGIGVTAAPLTAGTAAYLVQVAFGSESAFIDTVRTFWIGDAVAIASIAPFLLVVANRVRAGHLGWPDRKRLISRWMVVDVAATVLPPGLVILIGSGSRVEPTLALAVLPILWVALRHRPAAALLGLLVYTSTATYVVSANLALADDLIKLQSIMLASAVAALIIGAEVRQREDHIAQLTASEARYRRLVDGSPDLIVGFDGQGPALASPHRKFVHQQTVISHLSDMGLIADDRRQIGEVTEHEWTLRSGDDERWYRTRIVEEPDRWPAILSITTDLTDMRLAERRLAHARSHDHLTGLAHRGELIEFLGAATSRLGDEDGHVAVLHIGLDRFGAVNDIHGQTAGDEVLRLVASRLVDQVPPGCFLARMAGDEFAIAGFFPGDAALAEGFAQQIVELGREPVVAGTLQVVTTMSVGLAISTEGGVEPAELLQSAEVAANAAKEAGRDRSVVCDPQLLIDATTRREILAGLQQAVGTDQLILHYQPEFDLRTGQVVGYEALIRWNHPTRGLLLASDFIVVAEESRIIDEVTYQLIEVGIEQLAQFAQADDNDLFMGINLSPTQLDDPDLVDFIAATCERHGVCFEQLRIEVTETTVMRGNGHAPDVLRRLQAMGASVAIDDFGTGYASIGYLHQLPVNVIKIDHRFVHDIASNETDRALVRLIVGLAEGLDLTITAEGIETDEQREALIDLGCTRGQGYGMGRPESGADGMSRYAGTR